MSGIENSNRKSWVEILSRNDPSNQPEYDEALTQVRANYMQIYRGELYLRLEQKTLCEILDSNDLNVENEEVVFDSVRQWSIFNNLHCEVHLKSLLKVVRLSLLSSKYLSNEVEPFVSSFKDIRDTVINELRNRNFSDEKANVTMRKYQKISIKKDVLYINRKTTPDVTNSCMKLLSIGSDRLHNANIVEIYDGNLNQWIKANNLTIDRRNYSIALIENRVMLIGGTRSLLENTDPLSTVESLDLTTGRLLMEAPLNEPRQYAATVGVNKGKMSLVFVFGGLGKRADLNSVERWDALSRVWTFMQPMPSKRTGLAAATLENKIYILGGRIGTEYTNTMEAYSQEDGKWEAKAPMKEARAHFCVGVSNGYMYAVAGSKGFNLHINSVEKYDPFVDSWTTIANIMATGHVGVSSLGNRLICSGKIRSKSVLEYDSESNKWLELEDMHEPRSGYLIQLPEAMKDLQFDWDDKTSCKLLMIQNEESNQTKSLGVFQNKNNEWTRLKDLNIDSINFSVACFGDILLMIGGTSVEYYNILNTVYTVNLRTGKVSYFASLNQSRKQSAAVVMNQGTLTFAYAIGGIGDKGILKSVERWDSFSRTWIMVTPMMIARTGHGAVLLHNEIYVVGGKTGTETYDKTVEAYDFENDRWILKAPMNNENAFFGIATFKNYIFVVGGNRNSATPVNTVERYDPVQNIWTTIANISSKGAVGISSIGNRLICAGGRSSNIVQEYDENDKQWRTLKPMSNTCSGFLIELPPGLEIYSGDWIGVEKLVFLGGFEYNEAEKVEIFDVLKNTWRQLRKSPHSARDFNVNLISNKLLIIGGYKKKAYRNAVDAIDLSSGTFQSLPPLREAREYSSSAVVTYKNKQILYVIGGQNKKHLSSVEKWDPLTNNWTGDIPMPTARYQHGCVFLNGMIYAVGGISGAVLNIVEAFSVENKKWVTMAPMNNARRLFGITVFENHIYVAGGVGNSTVERYDPLSNTWTYLAAIHSHGQVGLCGLGDRLICAGGVDNTVQEYDVINNRWYFLPPKIMRPQQGYLLKLPAGAIIGNW